MAKTFETPCQMLTIDPPWMVHMLIRGQFTVEQAVTGQRWITDQVKDLPFALLIVDFHVPTDLDMATRKALAEGESPNLRGNVFVKASFEMRTLARVVAGGINLLKGIDCPRVFCDTLDEAKAWCQKRHDQLLKASHG